MTLELEGKVALVTGGSRGIGRAIALGLAKAGASVGISYRANEAAAQETVATIEAAGGKATALEFDVGDPGQVKEGIDALVKSQGGLQILVANAGVSIDGLLMRYKDDDLQRLFATNVFGAFYCARAATRPMMKSKWGRILFLSSVVGEMGNTGQAAYASSKSALFGMAKSMAKELASRSITANVIAPGYIETDMTKDMPEELKQKLVENIPLGYVGRPEDIAEAAVFLASDRARYITGQVLNVNGGLYM